MLFRSPHHRQAIAQVVHRITGKLLHEPTMRLKSPDAAGHAYYQVVRHLFALAEQEPAIGSV